MTGVRALSAIVAISVLLPAIVFGGERAMVAIVGAVVAGGLLEYSAMVDKSRRAPELLVVGLALYFSIIYGPPDLTRTVCMLGVLVLFSLAMMRGLSPEEALRRGSGHVLGVAWIGGFAACLPLLSRASLSWVWLLFAITWLGDGGAYFCGRAFGKHKLAPVVSPNKTWEGVCGGMALAVVGALGIRAWLLAEVPWIHAVVLGVLLTGTGVLGDLAESLVKRASGVKDSGRIMPGHGGFLDRVDSLLFSAPVLFLYLTNLLGL